MLDQRDDPQHEELIKLQRLNREHTVRLRQLGLDMAADLPADFAARLDEYAAIQAETGLLRIDETSLEQWYQDRKLDIINLAECSAAGRADCRRLEAQLANVTAETAELEALLAAADGDGASAAETGRRMVKLDKEIADSRHKLASMQKVPDDIHLVDIMEKVKELKALKYKS